MTVKTNHWANALTAALPIMVGYFPIGIAFGIYAVTSGLEWYWPFIIGLVQYSGAAQFFLVALMAQQTAPLVILSTLIILNMRHIFYGLPFLGSLPHGKVRRFLAIFWLTDEVYSVLTSRANEQNQDKSRSQRQSEHPSKQPPMHLVGFLAYGAWNSGCLLGGIAGDWVDVPQASLGFSLTALFVILVLEQWRTHRTMLPIAVALAAWLVVTSLGGGLSLGNQLLILMPGVMLLLAIAHWLKSRRVSA